MAQENQVRTLAEELRAISPSDPSQFHQTLGSSLGWSSPNFRLELTRLAYKDFHTSAGLLGNQPAILFSGAPNKISGDVIDELALFAYHSSIHWGIVTNRDLAIIFNSHWIREGSWYTLPPIHWETPREGLDLLAAMTPEGLESNTIAKVASRLYEPEDLLKPVDDALVDRLDHWRDEAIKFTSDTKEVDEKLQTLFSQLFIIRAVEDRSLAPDNLRLEATIGGDDSFDYVQFQTILSQAKQTIQSELFTENVANYFPGHILRGIIRDLYVPPDLPGSKYQYNFAWLTSDLLGRAYEKYLSNLLVPVPLSSSQLHMFEQPERDVERVSIRKRAGVYYTPHFLTNFLTEQALNIFYSDEKNINKMPTVADFSCGSASFLTHAADSIIRRLRNQDADKNWGREIIKKKKIVGVDNDERAVILARLSLWLRLTEEPNPLPLPALQEVIVVGDSLDENTFRNLPKDYDIVLGNPPFIATGSFEKSSKLLSKYETAKGRFDYSTLFVELAVSRLGHDGIIAMVVPNRLFQNTYAGIAREFVSDHLDLIEILDFGTSEVFEGISAYVGALIGIKLKEVGRENKVRVIKVKALPERYISAKLFNASLGNIQDEYVESFVINHPTGEEPWLFISPKELGRRVYLEENSLTLADFAGVYQGIKTGANDIFVVSAQENTDGRIVKVLNGLGEEFYIEHKLLRRVVFGSNINRYDENPKSKFLIYPYENEEVIPDSQLEQNYPQTFAYLQTYRSVLEGRKSLRGSGLKWYELVRKRELSWLEKKKLLIRDLAIEPSFALDRRGALFLIGGTAIVPANSDHLIPF